MPTTTAQIHRPNAGPLPVIRSDGAGFSFSVPGVTFTTKRGSLRRVAGCRDEWEAFALAKQLARKSGQTVTGWKLHLI